MTMDDEWGRPTEVTGEYARPSDLKGHLLIVYPIGYVDEIQTQYGPSDAIIVDVVDLDDKDEQGLAGKVYRRSTFFQNLLIGSLKSQIGSKVLGVMGEAGKQPKQFGWIHEIACPSENELWVAELLNWRIQKLILRPDKPTS